MMQMRDFGKILIKKNGEIDMRNYKKILKCIIIALVISFPINVYAETMYTNANGGLRLRSSYSTDSEVLDVIPFNAAVEAFALVVKGFESWIKVNYNNQTGYVVGKYLREYTTEEHDGMRYLGNFHCTAYTHTGSACANGNYPSAGYTIACNSLDFGTQVYIDGLGYRTVEDRGPDYLGSEWLDCFMDTYDECVAFGSQHLDVWVVE